MRVNTMDTQLDTVIQDLQGAIPLADPAAARVIADDDGWRAHQLHSSRIDVTAEPNRPRGGGLPRVSEGDEIEDDLDPMMPRLAP
jgi:hypothetical protein